VDDRIVRSMLSLRIDYEKQQAWFVSESGEDENPQLSQDQKLIFSVDRWIIPKAFAPVWPDLNTSWIRPNGSKAI
jgi:hypothetical protein